MCTDSRRVFVIDWTTVELGYNRGWHNDDIILEWYYIRGSFNIVQ